MEMPSMTCRARSGLAAVALGVVAALLPLGSAAAQPALTDPGLTASEVATGFDRPTGLRFLGPDELFVIEENSGRVKHRNGVDTTTVLDLNVNTTSEQGLLGVALHPQFETNQFVYLYYSSTSADGDSGNNANWAGDRISRFTWDPGTRSLTGEQVLRSFPSDPSANDGPNHHGGPMAFGPDGKLYAATGDLNRNGAEQNNQAQANHSAEVGGIFRLNDDGSVPDDNPFLGEANTDFHPWYAYGVRNSFGLAFDPVTGDLWDTENGPNLFDEINRVEPGFNSGWDAIMGPDARDAQDAPDDLVVLDGSAYSDPEFSFLDPVGITSIQFLHGSALGAAYDDVVVVGDIVPDRLYAFTLNDSRTGFELPGDLADEVIDFGDPLSPILFGTGSGGVTDLQVGPDGALYVLSYGDGAIYRIIPEPASAAMLSGLSTALLLRRRRAA